MIHRVLIIEEESHSGDRRPRVALHDDGGFSCKRIGWGACTAESLRDSAAQLSVAVAAGQTAKV